MASAVPNKHRQNKRLIKLGTWNARQFGAPTGRIDQDLKLRTLADIWNLRNWDLTDAKLGPHQLLDTQHPRLPKWTVISRGRVSLVLNDTWTQAWRRGRLPIRTDGLATQCRVMLVQIPCFQRLGLAVLVTYAPSGNVSTAELSQYFDNLENILTHVKPRYTLVLAGDFNADPRKPRTPKPAIYNIVVGLKS